MADLMEPVKVPAIAALKNVAAGYMLVERLIGRPQSMPGLGVMHGRSGYGKTFAAIFIQNKTGAVRVEMGVSWTRKFLLRNILIECGVPDREIPRTVAELAERVIIELGTMPNRPLIIDEADIAVDRGMTELIRELHDKSGAPILLVGEELLPEKLARVERAHNRVLDWVQAQSCDAADTAALAGHYCRGIKVADDLLTEIRKTTRGVARRICVNLEHVREHCVNHGMTEITLEQFTQSEFPFYTGERQAAGDRR